MNTRQQQGVALISVMFIVVVLTLLISQLLTQGRQNLERTRWLQNQAQAYQYAVGGEQMARQLLYDEFERLKAEQLAHSPIPGPVRLFRPDHGEILVELEDLQGRVNLNNLVHDDYAGVVREFLVDFAQQPQLAPLLADWIDGDSLARPGGREDDEFLNNPVPLRAANRPLGHVSELAILAAEPDVVQTQFAPWTTSLGRPTPLNINTLKPELAPLLNPRLSASQLENIQATTPFNSIQEILQSDLTAGLAINPALLTVTSGFFQANISGRFHDWHQPLTSRFWFDPVSGDLELIDRQLITTTFLAFHKTLSEGEVENDADFAL